jgi:mono/diheme cytochrome c family protein
MCVCNRDSWSAKSYKIIGFQMRISPTITVIILVSLAWSLQSCTSNNLEALQSEGPCFEGEILPIIVSNCAGSNCHNPQDRRRGYDFTSYDGIMRVVKPGKSENSDLIRVMRSNGSDMMPPSPLPPVAADQIDKIAEWIDLGAFTDRGCEDEVCDSLQNVSYVADIKPIMDLHCVGCHNVDNATAGFELDSYDLVSGLAQSDILLGTLTGDPAYVSMPWNAPPLSDCNIERVRVWIQEGALNN